MNNNILDKSNDVKFKVYAYIENIAVTGGNWPSTLALWLVDGLTWKSCIGAVGSCEKSAPLDEVGTPFCKETIDTLTPALFFCFHYDLLKVKLTSVLDSSLALVFIFISFQQCSQHGGACETNMDGYYIESVVLIALGFLWYIWRYKKVKELDRLNVSAWKCS